MEILLSLSRHTDDKRCPQARVRNLVSNLFDQVNCLLLRDIPVHRFKQMIADMLDGHVDIVADLLFAGNRLDKLVGNVCRERV